MTTLYFSNKPSQINKDLIRYIDTNLSSIVKMGMHLTFVVAKSDDADEYSRKGIVNFPTLIHNTTKYVGVDKIKAFFNTCHQNYKKNQTSRTDTDTISDYWSSILAKGDEDEGGDDNGDAMKEKAQKVVQDRQEKMSQRKPKQGNAPIQQQQIQPKIPSKQPHSAQSTRKTPPPPKMTGSSRKANIEPNTVDVIKNMQAGGEEGMDDQLMAKFFENQMETNM